MIATEPTISTGGLLLHLRPAIAWTDDQLFEFCQINRELRIERTAEGDLSIRAPWGGEGASRSSMLNLQVAAWAARDGSGRSFDATGGFTLPNGAMRSPDDERRVHVYRPDREVERLDAPETVSADPVLPGLVLELEPIWAGL